MAKTKSNAEKRQNMSYRLNDEGKLIPIKKSLPKGYEILTGTLTEPPGTR